MATSALFAVVYAMLGLFPISPYIGVRSFLTFREILAPLAGILFGPVLGGFSMIVGNFVDFALGKPVVFDFLDFVPDLASAVLAGLVFTGRRKMAVGLPVALIVWYSVDPLSKDVIQVGAVGVPFYWMHLLSVAVLGIALLEESRGRLTRLNPLFVGATVFASTMTGHIAGSILFENILVRVNHTSSVQAIQGQWTLIFYAYPIERILFTVLGTAISVPVMRSLMRRGNAELKASG